ncbi:30S ribosomal protein S21 [Candidatus Berkelbacteria bacterium]|nr:30S ribosomal protein S21 [Candidatus Berkelbacteria bacterium]
MADFQDSRDHNRDDRGSRERRPSFDVVLRRFFREVQQSRILSEVKKRRYNYKDVSRKLRRRSAIRKAAAKRAKRGY